MTARVTKKVGFSEEDVSSLLQRYNPTTILTLLQEVSQVADVKIDWNALVKKTATGISSAREYQMLWRHLAYHHTLLEKIEDVTDPLDDESDLEVETEAVPAASSETLSEAAACVKVLMSSGLPREQGLVNRANLEAPSTLNGLNDQTSRIPSDKQYLSRNNRSTGITVPTLQKQSLAAGISAEDGNGSAGIAFPQKKKRKLWTKEEDMELIAAVQKYGEGNWANILKGDFKHDRTASQLSQRWAIIRKRDTNLLAGSGNKTASSTRSEERLATQKAISLALDMPKSGRLSAMLSGGTQSVVTAASSALSAAQAEALPVSNQSHNQLQQASSIAASQKISLNTLNKPRTTPKKTLIPVKPSTGPNSLIQAAAFAAGGRIATPSTAASLFKAAQSKNAVHIRPGGGARPSQISNVKPLVVANTTSQQLATARFGRSATTVASSVSPASVSLCTSNGGQQVQGCSGSTGNNPLNTASTNQQALLESTISHEITDRKDDADMIERKDDLDMSAIDVDELLAEEVKCADEIELDDIMVQDDQPGMLNLDTSANEGNDLEAAEDASTTAEKQMVLPKSMVDENKNLSNEIVFPDVEAAEGNAMELDDRMAHEDQAGMPSLDRRSNEGSDFQNAHDADATADKQMNLPTSAVDENTNLDRNIISSNVEAAKGRAMKLDDKMAHEDQPVIQSLDNSANEGHDLHNAYEADATVGRQMDLPESTVVDTKKLENKIVFCDADATESKPMELDDVISHEDQPGLQSLDQSANEHRDLHRAHEADAPVRRQMHLPNLLVDGDKNPDHKVVSSDVEAAKNKAIESDGSVEQISIDKGAAPSNTHVDNNPKDNTVQEKAALCRETTIDDDPKNLANDKQVSRLVKGSEVETMTVPIRENTKA